MLTRIDISSNCDQPIFSFIVMLLKFRVLGPRTCAGGYEQNSPICFGFGHDHRDLDADLSLDVCHTHFVADRASEAVVQGSGTIFPRRPVWAALLARRRRLSTMRVRYQVASFILNAYYTDC
jgi:hypothetical protein